MMATKHSTSETVVRSWGLFLALALIMMGNGLLAVLLGVRAELETFGTSAIGLVMAGYYAGFLFGSQLAPLLLARVGHIRAFAGLASLGSVAVLVHAVAVSPPAWGLMRLIFGFCQAGLYVVAESWLNEQATNETRGRLLSIYMVTVTGAFMVGQILFTLGDPLGFTMFVTASVLVSLAVVPIALSQGNAPPFLPAPRLPARELWRRAPLGIVSSVLSGFSNGAIVGLGAVFALRSGMSTNRAAIFVAVAMAGGVVLQWPIGAISDRIPRRRWILVVTLLASVTAFVSITLPPLGWEMLVAVFVLGGLVMPMYSLAVSHVNDVMPSGQAATASAVIVFTTGLGAIAGPILTAGAMDVATNGFFVSIGVAHLLIAVFAIYRATVRKSVPASDQQDFVGLPWRSVGVVLFRKVVPNGRRKTPPGVSAADADTDGSRDRQQR